MTVKNDFPLPGGAFAEKRQVAKFDLIEKSFLTVILCYCAQRVSVEAGSANMGSCQSWLNRDSLCSYAKSGLI